MRWLGFGASAAALGSVFVCVCSAEAQLAPGDLLVSEIQDGSVVEFTGGGDFSGAAPFAAVLQVWGLCFGPGGDLYAATANGVYLATAGGDLSMATPFASGQAFGPIDCTPSRVLAGNPNTGMIYDVTAGGDFSTAMGFASVPGQVFDILTTSTGTVYAVNFNGVHDVTAGGAGVLVMSGFTFGLGEHQGQVLAASFGQIVTVPGGTPIADSGNFFGLLGAGSTLYAWDGQGTISVVSNGVATPFATGLNGTGSGNFYPADMVAVPGCGNGIVESPEACDTSGESAACDDDCSAPLCGDGLVNEAAGEACDEGGATATCDADCTLPAGVTCGDGVLDPGEQCDDAGESAACDDDCTSAECGDGEINQTAGEGCDDGDTEDGDGCSSACRVEVPTTTTTAPAATTGAATTGAGGSDGAGGGDGSGETSDGGCDCATPAGSSSRGGWLAALAALAAAMRRRRRR